MTSAPDKPEIHSDNVLKIAAFFILCLMTLICVAHFLLPAQSPLERTLSDAFKILSLMIVSFATGVQTTFRKHGPGSPIAGLLFAVCLICWVAMFFDDAISMAILLLGNCALGAAASFKLQQSVCNQLPIGTMAFTGYVAMMHIALILRTMS